MEFFEFATVVTVFGCITGVIITTVDKVFDRRHRTRDVELKAAQERARLQEMQIVELHRQNEALQKQVEWHARLLETQDRMMKQLTGGASGNGAGNGEGSHAVRHTR